MRFGDNGVRHSATPLWWRPPKNLLCCSNNMTAGRCLKYQQCSIFIRTFYSPLLGPGGHSHLLIRNIFLRPRPDVFSRQSTDFFTDSFRCFSKSISFLPNYHSHFRLVPIESMYHNSMVFIFWKIGIWFTTMPLDDDWISLVIVSEIGSGPFGLGMAIKWYNSLID